MVQSMVGSNQVFPLIVERKRVVILLVGPGQFGVVRRITSDEDKMENNTMYSCGSLAPKMKAKKDKQPLGTGCSACTKFTR